MASRWQHGVIWAGWALALASSTRAHAQSASVHVQVDGPGCPDSDAVRDQLVSVLPAGTALDVDAEPAVTGASNALVRDFGARYAVAVGDAQRTLDDPARDCVERARVASVFIALNLKAQLAAQPRPPAAEPKPEPADEDGDEEVLTVSEDAPIYSPEDWSLHFGLELFGAAAYSTELAHAAPGGGAGIWLARGPWRFAFDASVLAPADVALEVADDAGGTVALMRVPLGWSASYLVRAGSLRLGPSLGFQLDVLRMRGKGLEQPETALRINPGALLALDLHLHASSTVGLLLRIGASAFPRAYRLNVERAGRLGSTPRLWLSASVGMSWQLR